LNIVGSQASWTKLADRHVSVVRYGSSPISSLRTSLPWGLSACRPAADLQQQRWFAKKKDSKSKGGKEEEGEGVDPIAESENEIKDMDQKMILTIQNFVAEMGKLRTGRADPRMLDSVKVKAHDAEILLAHCAQVTSTDPRSLTVSVFDPELVKSVDKAIREAGLDLNPQVISHVFHIHHRFDEITACTVTCTHTSA
jgi:hypothetical protein